MTDRTQQIHRRVIPLVSPAAGAEIVITPNTVGHWRIMQLLYTFTASAAVAVRQTRWSLSDGTTTSWKGRTAVTQAAGTSLEWMLAPLAVAGAAVDGLVLIATPPDGLWVPKGWTLRTTTALIDVADQYSAISAEIQEIPDGPAWFAEPSMVLNTVLLDQ